MNLRPSTRMRLPSVCMSVGLPVGQAGVKFMTPFEMLRRERARFILGAARP